MKASIVLGLAFGDEGKGITTNYLCKDKESSIVVRFSGGHQAGHTVVSKEGYRHVFSNFGAATMKGVPTFWSKYCTFNPYAVVEEYKALKKEGFDPILYVDPLCPVTTPFDIMLNRELEKVNQHGSCGVGVGATIQRQEDYYKLYVQDLFFDSVLEAKLKNIYAYYSKRVRLRDESELPGIIFDFMNTVKSVRQIIEVENNSCLLKYKHLVFEGSQGILLDMDFGFFPNVTRSNTTSKNALEILESIGVNRDDIQIYYITRAYQTRHGNGFMTGEGKGPRLINNENETNVTNRWQGSFRYGALDIDLINYAIKCDVNFSHGLTKNLVVSCLDQVDESNLPILVDGKLSITNLSTGLNLISSTMIENILYSRSDRGELEEYNFRGLLEEAYGS